MMLTSGIFDWDFYKCGFLLLIPATFVIFILVKMLPGILNFWKQNTEKGEKREIPRYSHITGRASSWRFPVPLESSFFCIHLKRDGADSIEQICLKFPGIPIFEMSFILDTVKVVNCPQLAHKILKSSSLSVLDKPQSIYRFGLPKPVLNGLFVLDLKRWAIHRKVLGKSFTRTALHSHFSIFNRRKSIFANNILEHCMNSSSTVSTELLQKELVLYTMSIITDLLFGPGIATSDELAQYIFHLDMSRKLKSYRIYQSWNLVPFIWKLNPKKKEYKKQVEEISSFMKKAIEKLKSKSSEAKPTSPSLVEEMIRHGASEMEIFSEVYTFVLAGYDTSTATIQLCLQNLAEYPEIQASCQEEIDLLFSSTQTLKESENNGGDFDLSLEDLSNLKLLERCILETLRLTPAVPVMLRKVSETLNLEGHSFRKDTNLMIPLWALHRHPKVFENPHQFNPDRFLKENMENLRKSVFSFSLGPRICLGQRFAMAEIKIIFCWILRHFNVNTSDRLKDVLIPLETNARPARPYNLTLKKRLI